ncbi:hypothetical protein DAI22_04g241266 [Oryza sativa Japonica Group]|nr:hypothetical protein DAI22_04g241266 [Oryza sativa Japonica Group]
MGWCLGGIQLCTAVCSALWSTRVEDRTEGPTSEQYICRGGPPCMPVCLGKRRKEKGRAKKKKRH